MDVPNAQDQLIGQIYEASVFPERWPGLLQTVAEAVGAQGGNLIRSAEGVIEVFSSPGIEEVSKEFEREGWNEVNSRVRRLLARSNHPGFLTDSDLHSEDEIATMPMYTQFLTPRGVAAGAATVIQGTRDDAQVFAIEAFESHAASRAAVPILDSLRPHIARASVLAEQVRAARVASLVEAFNVMGAALGLLSSTGKLIASTSLFDQHEDKLFIHGARRLHLVDSLCDDRFRAALSRLKQNGQGASVAVRSRDGMGAGVLHLLPACNDALDLFSRVTIFALLSAPGNLQLPSADIISALFDLTPAEARVARGIANSLSPAEVARQLNVSVETVRTQLKRVYFKTSTRRQNDLSLLLAQMGRSPGPMSS